MKKVGIVMGSDSDLPIIQKATDMLKTLEIPFEVHVYSAHRTPRFFFFCGFPYYTSQILDMILFPIYYINVKFLSR